jgi:diguanylate cyclase (GGDEF)-like protein
MSRDGMPFTIFMLDLDRFKGVNDSLGHAAGDMLLKEVACRLRTSIRRTDILARLGGDEFAIIQSESRDDETHIKVPKDSHEAAIVLANRILEQFKQPFDLGGNKVFVGTSIGISLAPADGSEPDDLIKKADLALYETKSSGRNGYSFFDPWMMAEADERHQLEADMRVALARGEFELHYQPIVDAQTRNIVGMEALVRWRHPVHGLILPGRFIGLAEDTGLINPLGEWVLHHACQDAMAWPEHVTVAVNLSAVQFRKSNLLDVVLCALVDSGLPPERLEVEVTETVLLEKESDYITVLHQLRNVGVSVALDDFGTGYSSLSYLKTFRFDKIKIDRSFTRDIGERSDCAAIVCSIVGLGRSLGLLTTAEGVETEQQLDLVRAAGVAQAQGYLFGRPKPFAELDFDHADGARALQPRPRPSAMAASQ